MRIPALLLGAFLVGPLSAQPQLIPVGTAAMVGGGVNAHSTIVKAVGRAMNSGLPIYLYDRLTTDAKGRMQVLLLDESVFTVGPNSNMIVDEFIYDPKTGVGQVSARVTQGVFRFISGKISSYKSGKAKIKLPVGSIGISGTMLVGKVDGERTTVILQGPGDTNNAGEKAGRITIENEWGTVELSQGGMATTIEPGQPPSPPFEAPPSLINVVITSLSQAAEKPAPGGAQAAAPAPAVIPSAMAEAGQATASGASGLSLAETSADAGAVLSQVTQNASQDTIASAVGSVSQWDEVRALKGSALYSGSGAFTTTLAAGSPCLAACSGSWNYSVSVDLDARQISANASIAAPSINDSVSANLNYADSSAFPGQANIPSLPSGFGGVYQWTFFNKDSVIAKELEGTATFSDGSNAGIGAPIRTSR